MPQARKVIPLHTNPIPPTVTAVSLDTLTRIAQKIMDGADLNAAEQAVILLNLPALVVNAKKSQQRLDALVHYVTTSCAQHRVDPSVMLPVSA